MTAKDYLKQIELLDVKINQKEEQLACLRETAGGAAAIRYDKDNIQMSVSGDVLERNVIQLLELEDKIFQDKCRLESIRATIINQIQALEDKRYIEILYRRYVKFDKFEKIALDMSYDYTYVRQLHGEALGMFDSLFRSSLHNLTQSYKTMC